MKNLIISLLPLLISLHTVETDIWKPTSATISFTIKHALGATAEGSFKGFEGNLIFDPDNLATASLKGTVVAKTIHTGISLRDNTLRGDEYFAVEKYPKISLVSTKIEKSAVGNQYTGYFNLTIKDITKNIKLPFTFTQR